MLLCRCLQESPTRPQRPEVRHVRVNTSSFPIRPRPTRQVTRQETRSNFPWALCPSPQALLPLVGSSRAMRSLAVLRIGPKAVSSSGLDSSPLTVGLAASPKWVGHGIGWGSEWKPRDMEHISITALFIGGGLIRHLFNTTVNETEFNHPYHDEEAKQSRAPETYEFSLNPIPALVILLLGNMMSSHAQSIMLSTMVHKQWGNLLLGASFARGLTYVLMFLKPPKSVLPSRPPTELLASFGLISGGMVFMASAGDTVQGMIHYNMDTIFMYTVTMGLVGSLMAWEDIVLAIKGWAVRRERHREPHRIA